MVSTAIPSAIILFLVNSVLYPAIAAQKRDLDQASKIASAAITGIDIVKTYNGSDTEVRQYVRVVRRATRHYLRQVGCNCAQISYVKLWMVMLFVLGFYFAVVLINQGSLSPGDALTTFAATLTAFESLEALGPQWLVLVKGMAAGQSLDSITSETEDKMTMRKTLGSNRPIFCAGKIEMYSVSPFEPFGHHEILIHLQVSFAYPCNPSNVVLRSATFFFPAGETTFLVGRSGSGKSTLSSLLLAFYKPISGEIIVDGHPLNTLDIKWVRQNITLIQQTSILFNDTFLKKHSVRSSESQSRLQG